MTVLVCDLGGTGCRMALSEGRMLLRETYRAVQNADYRCFEDALSAFLQGHEGPVPSAAIIALAAPVTGDDIALSNRDWRLSKSRLAAQTGIAKVNFLNDLEALGHALGWPEPLDSQSVFEGAGRSGTRLVLGVGTGFNTAACAPGGAVICSETGHSTFPVETRLDAWLQAHFTQRFGRCSLERVLSGSGLGAVYAAVSAEAGQSHGAISSHEIISAARAGEALAARTCAEFCRILGRAAGDMALAFMPAGGIWLAGGISRALAPMISEPDGSFVAAFRSKGRMSGDMTSFSVRILTDDLAALQGCLAWYDDKAKPQRPRHMTSTERAI